MVCCTEYLIGDSSVPKGGTPPLVPMWPQPQVRSLSLNPFPFFPFNPRWGEGLPMLEYECFCALLRLAWVSPRPCYLPRELQVLKRWVEPCFVSGAASLTDRVLAQFTRHPQTGLLYFPPQLKFLQRLVEGENIYALLWDEV